MPEINWIAVIAATIAAFAVGALWYSPLPFVRQWQQEIGLRRIPKTPHHWPDC